jgi:hypothetical protein
MLVFGGLFSGLETQSEISRLLDELYDSSAQGNLDEAEELGASQWGAKGLSEKGAYEEESTSRFVLESEPEQFFSFTFQNAAPFGHHDR